MEGRHGKAGSEVVKRVYKMVSLLQEKGKPVITLHDLEEFMNEWLTVLNIREDFDSGKVVVFVQENDRELFIEVMSKLSGRLPVCVRVEIEHQGGPYR